MVILSRHQPELFVRLTAGALSGVVGGILMSVFLTLYHALITRTGATEPFNLIAMLLGYPLYHYLGAHTIAGMLSHLIFSAFLGLMWGLVFVRTPLPKASVAMGLVYGLIVYLFMFFLLIPAYYPAFVLLARDIPMLLGHLLFGLGVGLYPWIISGVTPRRLGG
jgi:uncharacterized membrane protein YagU involved in acid resistance